MGGMLCLLFSDTRHVSIHVFRVITPVYSFIISNQLYIINADNRRVSGSYTRCFYMASVKCHC